MSRLLKALASAQPLLMDGAMATELWRTGLSHDQAAEPWNLFHPDRVKAVHSAYVSAGARCLLTNTFQANPRALSRHGHADQLHAIIEAGCRLARSAVGSDGFVLGDIGPLADPWQTDLLRETARAFAAVDGILLETFSDVNGLWAVKYVCQPLFEPLGIPIFLSVTYQRTAGGIITTEGGQSPEVFANLAKQYGVAGLGVNCGRGLGFQDTAEIIRRYRQATDIPLFARPNAGTPHQEGIECVWPLTAVDFVRIVPDMLRAGASMIGGCCGTTPAYIAAARPILEEWAQQPGL